MGIRKFYIEYLKTVFVIVCLQYIISAFIIIVDPKKNASYPKSKKIQVKPNRIATISYNIHESSEISLNVKPRNHCA
jgi:hypothetical protein